MRSEITSLDAIFSVVILFEDLTLCYQAGSNRTIYGLTLRPALDNILPVNSDRTNFYTLWAHRLHADFAFGSERVPLTLLRH